MADEYRLAWIGAETLHGGDADLRLGAFSLEVLHSDERISTNGRVAAFSLEVLRSIESPIPRRRQMACVP